MLQQWWAISNTVPDLTSLRFDPQTSRSRDKRVTAWHDQRKYAIIYLYRYKNIIESQSINKLFLVAAYKFVKDEIKSFILLAVLCWNM